MILSVTGPKPEDAFNLTESEIKFEIAASILYHLDGRDSEITKIVTDCGFGKFAESLRSLCKDRGQEFENLHLRSRIPWNGYATLTDIILEEADELIILWNGKSKDARWLLSQAQKKNKPVHLHVIKKS